MKHYIIILITVISLMFTCTPYAYCDKRSKNKVETTSELKKKVEENAKVIEALEKEVAEVQHNALHLNDNDYVKHAEDCKFCFEICKNRPELQKKNR